MNGVGDFNFFSPYIEVKRTSKNKSLSAFFITGVVIVILFGFHFINGRSIDRLEQEIAALEIFLNDSKTEQKVNDINDKKEKIKILKQYYEMIENLNIQMEQLDVISTSLLEEIALALPQDIFLKEMSLTSNEILITGISENRKSIAEFEHNLKSIEKLQMVHVHTIREESNGLETLVFTMECTFKEGK